VPLQQARRRQSIGSASENGEVRLTGFESFLDGQMSSAPGQRQAAATVTVIVDDCLAIQILRLHDKAGRAEWPQPDYRADDTIRRSFHFGENSLGRGR
jgi:hypothetical protein